MSVLALSWAGMRGSDVQGIAGSATLALIDGLAVFLPANAAILAEEAPA